MAGKKFAILADEMGLGKSAQFISAADKIKASKILVVCRAVARINWKNEFNKFSTQNRKISIFEGRQSTIEYGQETVIICSYEGISNLLLHLGPTASFDLVGVDESHFVKSTGAKRSELVFGNNGLVRKTKRMWCLTGTPTPNNASEMWLPLYVFGGTKLTKEEFTELFCHTKNIGYGNQVIGTKTDLRTTTLFKDTIKSLVLKRSISDSGLNLPSVSFESVIVEPGPVDFYEHAEFRGEDPVELRLKIEEEYGIVEGILSSGKMSDELLTSLTASAGSISTLRRFIGLQKVKATADILSGELESDKNLKVIIFCQHRSVIAALEKELNRFRTVVVQGGVNQVIASKQIQEFQTSNTLRVFIGQIQAAGTSITLTASNEVVLLESSWVPADNAQAVSRSLRIGQTRPVRVRSVLLDDPVDRRISTLIRDKTEQLTKLYKKD